MNAVLRRMTNRCIDVSTRLYTTAGITAAFEPDGREDTVDLLRFIVILPERDSDDLRPEVSLASNEEVMGLYLARE
jgi:hypothetical protein